MRNKVLNQLLFGIMFFLVATAALGQGMQNQQGQEVLETETAIAPEPITVDGTDDTTTVDITPYDLDKVNRPGPVIREKIQNRIINWQEKKQAHQEKLQVKLEAKKQAMEQKKEQFQKKLLLIKDEKKQQIAEHLEEKLNDLNDHLVDRLTKKAETFETFLEKIQSRAEKLETAGAEVAEIYSSISSIQTEIDNFKVLLQAQASKDYVPEINTEDTVKVDIGAMHQELQSDLKALREALINIRKQIVSLVQNLKIINQSLLVDTETASPAATTE